MKTRSQIANTTRNPNGSNQDTATDIRVAGRLFARRHAGRRRDNLNASSAAQAQAVAVGNNLLDPIVIESDGANEEIIDGDVPLSNDTPNDTESDEHQVATLMKPSTHKKRAADRQITKDDRDSDDEEGQDSTWSNKNGSFFPKASEETLQQHCIVKAKRPAPVHQTTSSSSTNPFAAESDKNGSFFPKASEETLQQRRIVKAKRPAPVHQTPSSSSTNPFAAESDKNGSFFPKASEETLQQRRIVQAKRPAPVHPTTSSSSTNPFAAESDKNGSFFPKASEETLQQRRIVQAKRPAPVYPTTSSSSTNPFAAVVLVSNENPELACIKALPVDERKQVEHLTATLAEKEEQVATMTTQLPEAQDRGAALEAAICTMSLQLFSGVKLPP